MRPVNQSIGAGRLKQKIIEVEQGNASGNRIATSEPDQVAKIVAIAKELTGIMLKHNGLELIVKDDSANEIRR